MPGAGSSSHELDGLHASLRVEPDSAQTPAIRRPEPGREAAPRPSAHASRTSPAREAGERAGPASRARVYGGRHAAVPPLDRDDSPRVAARCQRDVHQEPGDASVAVRTRGGLGRTGSARARRERRAAAPRAGARRTPASRRGPRAGSAAHASTGFCRKNRAGHATSAAGRLNARIPSSVATSSPPGGSAARTSSRDVPWGNGVTWLRPLGARTRSRRGTARLPA